MYSAVAGTPLKRTATIESISEEATNSNGEELLSPSPFVKEHSVFFNTASRRQNIELSHPRENVELSSGGVVSSPAVVAGTGALHHHPRLEQPILKQQLLQANHEIGKLKHDLSVATTERDLQRVELEGKLAKADSLRKHQHDRIDALERDLRMLYDSECELKRQLAEFEDQRSKAITEVIRKLTEATVRRKVLEEENEELRSEVARAVRALNEARLECDSAERLHQTEIGTLRQQLAGLEQRMAERSLVPKVAEPAPPIGTVGIDRSLLAEAAKAASLESSNRQLARELEALRGVVQNNGILEDQIHALKLQLSGHIELQERYSKLEAEMTASQRGQLESGASPVRGALEAALAAERIGELDAQAKAGSMMIQTLKDEQMRQGKLVRDLESRLREYQVSTEAMQQRERILQAENASLREHIAALETIAGKKSEASPK